MHFFCLFFYLLFWICSGFYRWKHDKNIKNLKYDYSLLSIILLNCVITVYYDNSILKVWWPWMRWKPDVRIWYENMKSNWLLNLNLMKGKDSRHRSLVSSNLLCHHVLSAIRRNSVTFCWKSTNMIGFPNVFYLLIEDDRMFVAL